MARPLINRAICDNPNHNSFLPTQNTPANPPATHHPKHKHALRQSSLPRPALPNCRQTKIYHQETQAQAKDNPSDGLLITEDDDLGWGASGGGNSDEDGETPITAGTSAEFRRAKKNAWKTVGAPIPTDTKDARDDAAAADAIIASAAAETAAAAREADGGDAPMVEGDDDVPMMNDGSHAGLQSAKALTAQLKRRQKAERDELARLKAEKHTEEEPELVLRDATGRRVDISMRRAEARRAATEAEDLEEAQKRALKGDVQLEEARKRREMLQDAALMPLARHKDDEEMNREMKGQERWNDPMAEFLDQGGEKGKKEGGGSRKRKPVYKGAAPPNRYGIKPGYRWDGVDRGNGFEAERFKAINRRERNKGLDYAWQMDE